MAHSAFGPRERIHLDFASATIDVAQHPSAGVAKVGARMARFAVNGTMSPAEVAGFNPTEDELKKQVSVTAASHRLAGVYGIPPGVLQKSVSFAFNGLVLGSLIGAGAEFADGEHGKVLTGTSVDNREGPVIDIPSSEQSERFAELAANPDKMYEFGKALGAISAIFADPMSGAQGPLEKYHADLTAVSAKYANDANNPARMGELGNVRDELATDLRPFLIHALPASIGETTGNVLVANTLRNNPTGAVIGRYLGSPQT